MQPTHTDPGNAGAEQARSRVMATAELTVIGLGRSDPSAGEYIAEIQRRLAAQEKVRYKLQAMGTELEGSTEDILAVVAELHRVPFELGLPRVYTVLKLDERRDKEQTLEDKVRSVEERLQRISAGGGIRTHMPRRAADFKSACVDQLRHPGRVDRGGAPDGSCGLGLVGRLGAAVERPA